MPGNFRPEVMSWGFIDWNDPFHTPESSLFEYRILAEGDSWFSLGAIPTSNLLFSMRFPRDTVIANCAYPGDTIRRMATLARDKALREAFSQAYNISWDLILLSGGGNDVLDEADDILLMSTERGTVSGPADYCDQAKLQTLLDEIGKGYRQIVAFRDAAGSTSVGKPIVTHTYDIPTPRNSPSNFIVVPVLGPWLQPAMHAAQVPVADRVAVSKYLIDSLADTILGLANGPNALPNFFVVDTRGTLTPAQADAPGVSGDWMNEIHPDSDGYKKLAKLLEAEVMTHLPPPSP
jgi:hypothetical protein